ncbi:MAG: hypothetical protein ACT4QB_13630 [Gammaproteobacteria bacterium]
MARTACMLVVMVGLLFRVLTVESAVESPDRVVVIVNRALSSHHPASQNMLSAIFGMRLGTWEDGIPVRVHVLPDDHPVHVKFSKQILGVFPHQLRTAWDRMVYSGTGQAPLEVDDEGEMRASVAATTVGLVVVGSEEEMRRKVSGSVGAIGYLSEGMVDGTVDILPTE